MLQDIRFALRLVGRQRAFACLVVVALAFGIGLAATVFAFVDGVLFKPLPYRDPAKLYAVFGAVKGDNPGSRLSVSPADFLDWRARARSWSGMEAFQPSRPLALDRSGELVTLQSAGVTQGFLELLGVTPSIGRGFVPADFQTRDTDAPAAILTFDAWRRVFASDLAVLGRRIGDGSTAVTIVGLLPQGSVFPTAFARQSPDVLRPYVPPSDSPRTGRTLQMIGRLRDGTPAAYAQQELSSIALSLKPLYGGSANMRSGPFDSAMVIPLSEHLAVRNRQTFGTAFGSVLVVVLLTCLNVCALLLARGLDRSRELGVRSALGASRAALIRQLLMESALLSAGGAAVGVLLAVWGTRTLAAAVPGSLLLLKTPEVDVRVLAFVALAGSATTLLAGMWPAMRLSRSGDLCAGIAASATATRRGSAQFALLAGEMTLATILVVAGALMVASLWRVYSERIGMTPRSVLTMTVTSRPGAQAPAALEGLLVRLRARPDVESVALTSGPLLDNASMGSRFPMPRPDPSVWATDLTVSGEYFQALGIPLIAGRVFSDEGDAREIVVSRSVQQAFWPGETPLGRRLTNGDGDYEVVGVVEDSRDISLERQPAATFYFPLRNGHSVTRATLIARMRVPPAVAAAAIRRDVQAADLLVSDVIPLKERADRTIAERRFNTALFALFGGAGLALAFVGAYGIVAYSIARRLRELGIRRALGARTRQIAVVSVAGPLGGALGGVAAGLAAAFWFSSVLRRLVYGVDTTEPWVYTAAAVTVLLPVLAACVVPVRRATRVDPIVALRTE